ncbi:heat shock protein beta-2 [Sigmodon hispidus]
MSGRTVPHAHPATAEYEFANPSRLGEQRFGEGLLPEEILTPTLYHGYYVRPRAARAGEGSRAGASELRLSEGKFQAFLDVSHFTPDEVTVRTVDNLLEVSARHPQRLDRHGFVSREFCRTYVLPADVDPWRVRAALSHDGILNLEAPRGGRHLDTEVNEVYISLLPAPPDPEEEEEANLAAQSLWLHQKSQIPKETRKCANLFMSENQLGFLGDTSAMGNRLCCGGSWSCPSAFPKKNKTGSQARPTLSILKQQQPQLRQNGTKDYETTGPMYEQVLHRPGSQKRSSDSTCEESNLHYADIHVLSQLQPCSSKKVKHLHLETATEYATLHFPQATPRYDRKNGTLV